MYDAKMARRDRDLVLHALPLTPYPLSQHLGSVGDARVVPHRDIAPQADDCRDEEKEHHRSFVHTCHDMSSSLRVSSHTSPKGMSDNVRGRFWACID